MFFYQFFSFAVFAIAPNFDALPFAAAGAGDLAAIDDEGSSALNNDFSVVRHPYGTGDSERGACFYDNVAIPGEIEVNGFIAGDLKNILGIVGTSFDVVAQNGSA